MWKGRNTLWLRVSSRLSLCRQLGQPAFWYAFVTGGACLFGQPDPPLTLEGFQQPLCAGARSQRCALGFDPRSAWSWPLCYMQLTPEQKNPKLFSAPSRICCPRDNSAADCPETSMLLFCACAVQFSVSSKQ